jgi:hypothetical protein
VFKKSFPGMENRNAFSHKGAKERRYIKGLFFFVKLCALRGFVCKKSFPGEEVNAFSH